MAGGARFRMKAALVVAPSKKAAMPHTRPAFEKSDMLEFTALVVRMDGGLS